MHRSMYRSRHPKRYMVPRFYILLRISFSAIRFPRFASFFVDRALVVSVAFSPVTIVSFSFDSVLGNLLTVSLLLVTTDFVILILCWVCVNVVVSGDVYGAVVAGGGVTTDSVILIPSSVPRVNVDVLGDVYGAVVAGGGHVNIPTFPELQIRSLTEVQNRKIIQPSVSNSKQRTKQNLAIKNCEKTFKKFRKNG